MINFYFRHKETIDNVFWRGLQILSKQGISFLILILCARLLEPYDFGIYNYILAFIFLLITFSDFGVSLATSKFVAEYRVVAKYRVKYILYNSVILISSFSLLALILFFVLSRYFSIQDFEYLYYVAPMILFLPLTSMYDGIYRGLKRFKNLAITTSIVGFLSLFFVYFLIINYGVIGALISQTLFYIFLFIGLALGYRDVVFKFDPVIVKNILYYSVLIGIANIAHYFYTKIDILILGHFNFIEEIGYYELINTVLKILVIPVGLLAIVIAPNTTKNFSLKKYDYLSHKIFKETKFLFLGGILMAIIAYFVLPYIFIWFLPGYDAYLLVQILTLMLILLPIKFISNYLNVGYITPSGYVKILAVSTIVFGVLNVLLNFIFITSFGFIGVVYATMICLTLFTLTNVFCFYKNLSFLKKQNKIEKH